MQAVRLLTAAAAQTAARTLEVWSSNLSDSAAAENVKKLVAQYEEQTGVKVNYTEFSYDMLHDKILSAAAGGNTPDVAWGLPEWTGEFHSMGILEDLSDPLRKLGRRFRTERRGHEGYVHRAMRSSVCRTK